MPHGVDGGVTFVENNEEWGSGDALCQCFTVQILPEETKRLHQITLLFNYSKRERIQFFFLLWLSWFNRKACLKSTFHLRIMSNLLCVELHPLLQLPGDILVLPLSQVGDNDSRVEGACVSPHPQLLDGLLLEVQESYIVVLLKAI